MLTAFGKFCRVLRTRHDEILKDMANKLNVSSAFLSSVENGKKEIPASWFDKITDLYSLSKTEKDELAIAIATSRKEYRINLENISSDDRVLALTFARKLEEISNMNEHEKDALRSFLKKHK